jgi:hypothetical protein
LTAVKTRGGFSFSSSSGFSFLAMIGLPSSTAGQAI